MSRAKKTSTRSKIHSDPTYGELFMASLPPDPELPDPTPLEVVYFGIDHQAAQVKIGVTANLDRRLQSHKERGRELDIVGTLPGGRRLEHALHRRFAPYRREGREWYTTEILPEVQTILAA